MAPQMWELVVIYLFTISTIILGAYSRWVLTCTMFWPPINSLFVFDDLLLTFISIILIAHWSDFVLFCQLCPFFVFPGAEALTVVEESAAGLILPGAVYDIEYFNLALAGIVSHSSVIKVQLLKPFSYSLAKRYYPGGKPPTIQELVRFRQILDLTTHEKTPILRSDALIPYNPARIAILQSYGNSPNPYLHAQLDQYYKNNHYSQKEKVNLDRFKSIINKDIQAAIDYINQINAKEPISIEWLIKYIKSNSDIDQTARLEAYFNSLKSSKGSLSEQEEALLENLESFLNEKKKEILELLPPLKEYPPIKDVDKMTIKEFLTMRPLSRSFTKEDYELEKALYKQAITFLKSNNYEFSDQEILRFLEHARILKFGHVFWREDGYDIDSLSFGLTQQFKEGEGAKISHKGYSFIQKDNSMQSKPTELQLKGVVNNLESKNFFIGLLKKPVSIDALMLSSHDLHLLCVVPDPLNPEYGFIVGMYTSAKDSGTTMLSKTQEINCNPDEENKEQHFRPFTKLVRVKLSELDVHSRATAFAKGFNKEKKNVHQIIVEAINKKCKDLLSNNIEDPIAFTKDVLIKLAKAAFKQLIKDAQSQIDNIEDKLKSKFKKEQKDYKAMLESQKINHIKKELDQYAQDSLSKNDQYLIKILGYLKKRKNESKQDTNNKIKLPKDIDETKKATTELDDTDNTKFKNNE